MDIVNNVVNNNVQHVVNKNQECDEYDSWVTMHIGYCTTSNDNMLGDISNIISWGTNLNIKCLDRREAI